MLSLLGERREYMQMEEYQEHKIIYEVRGRGNIWKVSYPDEGDIKLPVPVYDKEGKLKTVIYAGGNSEKLTESFQEFSTAKEAIKEAKMMGAEKIKLIKTKKRKDKEQL